MLDISILPSNWYIYIFKVLPKKSIYFSTFLYWVYIQDFVANGKKMTKIFLYEDWWVNETCASFFDISLYSH